MNRILVLTILLLANFSVIASSVQTPRDPDCPTLTVTCPEEPEPGKPLKFKANVVGGKPKFEISYNWTVDKGKISFGQGTSTVEVDLEGKDCQGVTATVELGGVDPKCTRAASCAACIR
jgi:hypothetical protein